MRANIAVSPVGAQAELTGPVGEQNLYELHPRGRVLLMPQTKAGLIDQLGAALAGGNDPVVADMDGLEAILAALPESVAHRIRRSTDWRREGPFAGALIEGDDRAVVGALAGLADLPGPIVLPQASGAGYRLDWLVEEESISINTTAAGGNASLMTLSD